jgi:hypothetical protein
MTYIQYINLIDMIPCMICMVFTLYIHWQDSEPPGKAESDSESAGRLDAIQGISMYIPRIYQPYVIVLHVHGIYVVYSTGRYIPFQVIGVPEIVTALSFPSPPGRVPRRGWQDISRNLKA